MTHDPDNPTQATTILDSLRQRREAIAQTSLPKLTLEIPGYEGKLFARYRYPERGYEAITDAMIKAQDRSQPDAALNGNCDVLIACCETLLGRKGDKYVDLRTDRTLADDDDMPESPVRFNKGLAELFGIEMPDDLGGPARFVCRHVFSPRAQATGVYDGDLGLMTQGGRVITWLQRGEDTIAEAFVGES